MTMAMEVHGHRSGSFAQRHGESIEYGAIYMVAFAFFLLAATAHRLIPSRWRPNLDPSGKSRSIIAEARAAAGNSVPFAFM
jgi:hypothetical protein